MDEGWPFVVSVTIGSIVLGSVLWNYLRQFAQQSVVLSTSLSLIGFVLISSPLWGTIVMKGPQWEVTLLEKRSETQAQKYLELVEAYQKLLSPQKAAQIAPTVNDLRASVQEKKIDETVKLAEKLTLTITKAVP